MFTLSKSYSDWTVSWVQQCLNDPNFPTPSANRQHRETLLKILTAYVDVFYSYRLSYDFILESKPVVQILKIILVNFHWRAVKRYQKITIHKTNVLLLFLF